MNGVAVVAGSISTALFVVSALPMLYKAVCTRDLSSYSFGNLVLANVGNGFYAIYVFSMPLGPIWALHGFYMLSSAMMLFWYLRYGAGKRHPHSEQATDRSNTDLSASVVARTTTDADKSALVDQREPEDAICNEPLFSFPVISSAS